MTKIHQAHVPVLIDLNLIIILRKKNRAVVLLNELSDVFTERPGLCKVHGGQHEINVLPDFKPKHLKAYRIPELCTCKKCFRQ